MNAANPLVEVEENAYRHSQLNQAEKRSRWLELAGLFLRLGFTGFGGPAAHIALFRDETVKRRKWLSEQHFLDLLAAANLIPGPNSTELAIHLGYLRGGWPGLFIAGFSFVLPATGIVLLLSWIYATYGSLPQAGWLLYGIKPVIIAIIAQALWSLGKTALKDAPTVVIGVAALVLSLAGLNEILIIAAGAVSMLLWQGINTDPIIYTQLPCSPFPRLSWVSFNRRHWKKYLTALGCFSSRF